MCARIRSAEEEKHTRTPPIKKTGETQPPEAETTPETASEAEKCQKTPEFIRASGEICKKLKFNSSAHENE
jgi:hypothetical protein